MKKQKTKLPPLEGADVCGMMHTALRKIADSHATSAAYNLVHLICETRFSPRKFDPWRVYGDLVAKSIDECTARGEKLVNPYIMCKLAAEALPDAVFRLEDRKQDEKMPSNARCAMYALQSVFRCFDEEDWTAMASYLLGEEERG